MRVTIPAELKQYSGEGSNAALTARDFEEFLRELAERYPDLAVRILVEDRSALRSHVMLIKNGELVQSRHLTKCRFAEDDTVEIFLIASGG